MPRKPIRCEACEDRGFYLDTRCRKNECAHVGSYVPEEDSDGNHRRVRRKVMDCPKRPCTCAAGDGPRRELRERIAAQSDRLSVEVDWER